jgi:hypothetical protein
MRLHVLRTCPCCSIAGSDRRAEFSFKRVTRSPWSGATGPQKAWNTRSALFDHCAGRKQVLIVEDWAEIRRLHKSEGVSISEIARVIGCRGTR